MRFIGWKDNIWVVKVIHNLCEMQLYVIQRLIMTKIHFDIINNVDMHHKYVQSISHSHSYFGQSFKNSLLKFNAFLHKCLSQQRNCPERGNSSLSIKEIIKNRNARWILKDKHARNFKQIIFHERIANYHEKRDSIKKERLYFQI